MASRSPLSRALGAFISRACSSSPGIKGAVATAGPVAAWTEAAVHRGMRNVFSHADGLAAFARPASDGFRGLHTKEQAFRGGRRLPVVVMAMTTLVSLACNSFFGGNPPNSTDWIGIGHGTLAENQDYLPDCVDWTKMGAVTPVRNQGRCGNCWAHATIGAIESGHKIATGKLIPLSVQQLTDCVPGGCRGAHLVHGFMYALCGITTEAAYPQRGDMWQGICRSKGMLPAVVIESFSVTDGTEEGLQRVVAKQPVAVYMDWSPVLDGYKGGILDYDKFPTMDDRKHAAKHCVLAVAYNTSEKGVPFWTLKNSHDQRWGENGFFRIRRGVQKGKGVGGIRRRRGYYPNMKRQALVLSSVRKWVCCKAPFWLMVKAADNHRSTLDTEDEVQEDDHSASLGSHQLMEEMEREREAYCTTMPDEKAVVQEYMEEDEALRARFEEWMEEYGRTYKDEVEKARRFKIFKSFARCMDAANTESVQAGSSARFGLTEYADWNAEERSGLFGAAPPSDEEFDEMAQPDLSLQGMWDKVYRAVIQGIPEIVEAPHVALATPASGQQTNLQAPPPAQPAVAPPAQPSATSAGPNAKPLNLFPQGVPSGGANPGAIPAACAVAGASALDALRELPQFQALLQLVQANPQILQPMLQELGKQDPQILRLIQEIQAEFLRLVNECPEGGAGVSILGQLAAAVPQALTVTPEERDAIQRLEGMGFSRELVQEVFFACNKDEELAANFLLVVFACNKDDEQQQ